MNGLKKNELAVLDAGLKEREVGLDYIPAEIEARLDGKSLDELHELLRRGMNIVSLLLAQKGWTLMMIKRVVGHGNFKAHLHSIGFNYVYAAQCMKVAQAIGKHPALAHINDTNLMRRVAYLPDHSQQDIEVKLKVKSALDDSSTTYTDLRPWILERIASDMKAEDQMKRRKPLSAEKLAAIEALSKKVATERSEKKWAAFEDDVLAALQALGKLAKYDIEPHWFDRIFEHDLLPKLGRVFDAIAQKMHPIEEIQKREKVIRAPGFARA
jgi:hypothetical protein